MQQTTDDLLKRAMDLQREGRQDEVLALLDPHADPRDRDIRLTVQLAEAQRRLGRGSEAAGLYRDATLFYASEGMLAHAVALERLVAGLRPLEPSILPPIAAAYAHAPAGADGGAPFGDLFVSVDEKRLDAFFRSGKLLRHAARDVVLEGASEGRGLLAVLRGEIRIYSKSDSGRWVEASRLRGGQVFDAACLTDERSPGRAVAAFASTLIEVPAAQVEVLAEEDDLFATALESRRSRLQLERCLVSHPTFGALSQKARMALSRAMDQMLLRRGSMIFREGDASEHLYLVLEGRVEVFTQGAEGRLELAQLGAGQLFGESAALGRAPRTASVRARTDVTIYRISADRLDDVLADQPEALDHLKNTFRSRVTDTLQRLDDDNG